MHTYRQPCVLSLDYYSVRNPPPDSIRCNDNHLALAPTLRCGSHNLHQHCSSGSSTAKKLQPLAVSAHINFCGTMGDPHKHTEVDTSMPSTIGIFIGTNAAQRNGNGTFSCVSGWIVASTTVKHQGSTVRNDVNSVAHALTQAAPP